mgnify:CR=1 FL=1
MDLVKNPLHSMAASIGVYPSTIKAPTLSKKMNISIPQNILFPPSTSVGTRGHDDAPLSCSQSGHPPPAQKISAQFSFPSDLYRSKTPIDTAQFQGNIIS